MSRRDAFRAGGVLATAPVTAHLHLLSSKPTSHLFAASAATATTPSKVPSLDLSAEVGDYACRAGAVLSAASRSGPLTHKQLSQAASLISLTADHASQTGLDTIATVALPKLSSGIFLQDHSAALQQAVAFFKKYDPGLDTAGLPTFQTLNQKQADMLHTYVSTVGVSGALRGVSDMVKLSAHYAKTGVMPAVELMPHMHEHLLRADAFVKAADHPHLLRVCEPKKPAICNEVLVWAAAGIGGVLALLAFVCAPPILAGIVAALPGIGLALVPACATAAASPYLTYLAVVGLIAAIVSIVQLLYHC